MQSIRPHFISLSIVTSSNYAHVTIFRQFHITSIACVPRLSHLPNLVKKLASSSANNSLDNSESEKSSKAKFSLIPERLKNIDVNLSIHNVASVEVQNKTDKTIHVARYYDVYFKNPTLLKAPSTHEIEELVNRLRGRDSVMHDDTNLRVAVSRHHSNINSPAGVSPSQSYRDLAAHNSPTIHREPRLQVNLDIPSASSLKEKSPTKLDSGKGEDKDFSSTLPYESYDTDAKCDKTTSDIPKLSLLQCTKKPSYLDLNPSATPPSAFVSSASIATDDQKVNMYTLKPQSSVVLPANVYEGYTTCMEVLLMSTCSEDLFSYTSKPPSKTLSYVSIELTRRVEIEEDANGKLVGRTDIGRQILQWKDQLSKDAKSLFKFQIVEEVEKAAKDVERFSEIRNTAHVKERHTLSSAELKYVEHRSRFTSKAIRNFLGLSKIKQDHAPRISVAMSGGGYRAMVGAVGFLMGLKESGILDCSNYVASLSGSTYSLMQWLMYGPDFDSVRKQLINSTKEDLMTLSVLNLLSVTSPTPMLHGLIQKTFFGQPIALADFFGTVLFSKFFPYDNTTEWSEMFKYYMTLSDQQTVLSPSKFPFPLYTAVHHDLPTDTYPWLTFTPSHIHISHYDQTDPHLISSLPVWGLGRDFESGNSVDSRPEVPLGILMGVFGSAFSASVNRIWDEVKEMFPKQLLDKVGDMIEKDPKLAEFHVIPPAVFPNPMYNLREQQTTTSDINSANNPVKPASTDSKDATPEVFKLKDLTVMDAGIDFNFPLPPLTHPQRESDIILLFDASEDIATNINTDRANEFMKRWGIPFPTLQKSDVLKSPVTVFPPPKGTDGPTVIYFPLVNLKYGDETVDLVDLKRDKMRKEDISFVNEMLVERFNPVTEDCCKTTNFVWNANQIMAMTELVRCNVLDSRDQIKNVIQAVYDSKKAKIG